MPLPLVAALPAAIQAGTGLFQLGKSLFGKQERPKYEIPSAVKQQVMESQSARRAGRSIADEMIARQQASATDAAMQGASSGVDVASGALAAMQAGNQALRQQDAMDLQNYEQKRQRALTQLGQQQMAQFQYDVLDPYQRKMQEKAALTGAGLQNIMGAAKGLESRKALQGQWQ